MEHGEVLNHHLESLERSFQLLRDQTEALPAAREALAPALLEVAQAIAALKAARPPELMPGSCGTILSHVFEAIPDLITVEDEDLNVILSNWHGHEFITPEERRGRPKCYQVFLHRDLPCEPCIVQEVFSTGKPVKQELFNPVDNQIREVHAFPVFDQAGQATLVAKHVRNITALRQVEKALQESEELFRVLTEGALAGVYLIQDDKFRYVNPVLAQIFGYDQEEIIDRLGPRDLIHPDERPFLDDRIRRRLAGEVAEAQAHLRGLKRDGTIIHIETISRRVDYQGRPAIIGTLLDVTARVRTEAALAEREELYRVLTERSLAGVYLLQDNVFRYANPMMAQIFGYAPEEIVNRLSPRDLIHPDDHPLLDEQISLRLSGEVEEAHYFARGVRRDGTIMHLEFLGRRIDYQGRLAIIGTMLDITPRVRAEEERREVEQQFRSIFDSATDGILIVDPETKKFYLANPMIARMLGCTQEELLNMGPMDIHLPDSLPYVLDQLERQRRGELTVARDIPVLRQDGSVFYADISASPFVMKGKIFLTGIFRDITERRAAEEALKTQAQVLTSMAEAVHVVDEDGSIVFANPAAYTMYGYPEGELVGQNVAVLNDLPREASERRSREIIQHLQKEGTWFGEIWNRTRNGTAILTYARVSTLELPGKKLWVAVHEDITARKRLEETTAGYLQFIRLLLETIPNPIFYRDSQGMILGCNKAFAEHVGVSQEEIPGKTVYNLFSGEVARLCHETDQQALEHPGTRISLNLQVPGPDGSIRQIICQKAALTGSSGGVGGVVSVITDITDLQQAQEALKASEARYRLLAENVHDVLWMMNLDYALTYVSPSIMNMAGYTPEEFLSLGLRQVVLPDYHRVFGTSLEKLLAPEAPLSISYEVEYRRKDNSIGWAEITVALMRDEHSSTKGLTGLARDITLRKCVEDSLRESEARYRALFEASPHATCLMDLQTNVIMVNQKGLSLFGFDSVTEMLGRSGLQDFSPEDRSQMMVSLQNIAETGQLSPVEVKMLTRGGAHIPCLASAALVRNEQGEPQTIIGVAQDITNLKWAEESLATHLEFMRVLLDAIPNPVFYKDVQGIYLGCNKAFEALMGISREEIVGKTVHDLHPRDLADKYHQMDLELFQNPNSQIYETLLRSADGTLHQVFANKAPFRDADGQVAGLVGNIVDISELRRAEEAVRESEARLRAIFEHAPVGITMVDPAGRFLQTNPTYQAIVGYDGVELQGMTWMQLTHPEDLPGNQRLQEELLAGQRQYYSLEKRYLRKDGKIVWVNMMMSRLQNAQSEPRVVSTVIDVTARKRAEEALRESEGRLQAILDATTAGILIINEKGIITFVNRMLEELFVYPKDKILGVSYVDLVHPDERHTGKRFMEALISGKITTLNNERHYIRADGTDFWGQISGRQFFDSEGNFIGLVGAINDITERRRAEEALRESEERFRLMAETIQDSFWIADARLEKLIYVSPGYERIWGRPVELEANLLSFMNTIHPEDLENVKTKHLITLDDPRPWNSEYRIVKPDGEVRWIQDRGFPVQDEQGQVILFTGVATDITERKTLEQQLLLAQKMEAVGRLAGGVAHDFNNLLMAIMGYGEIMQAKVLKGDPLYEYLEDILKATDRAAALTSQLLTFSRRQIVHPQVVDLNQAVLDLDRMLRRLIEEDIELKIITAPKLGAVQIDPGQLNQIIMNLVINARDAIACGGRIIVETAEVDFDTSHQTRSGMAPPGPYVMLEVSDSGIGMDESIQAHIFEPFFTTKEPGKGTGLGLSTVYGIVKRSGGFIDLESESGLGSTFTIYLPRLRAATKMPPVEVPQPMQFRGKETILLVEDEDVLRALLAKFLRLYGYTVLEARHGGEALLACEQHHGPIHLMVTDVVMPQMSGRVLADRLASLRPEMKVLYMSGYTEDEVVQRGVAELSMAFLQKPFRPIDLVQEVHNILHLQGHR